MNQYEGGPFGLVNRKNLYGVRFIGTCSSPGQLYSRGFSVVWVSLELPHSRTAMVWDIDNQENVSYPP